MVKHLGIISLLLLAICAPVIGYQIGKIDSLEKQLTWYQDNMRQVQELVSGADLSPKELIEASNSAAWNHEVKANNILNGIEDDSRGDYSFHVYWARVHKDCADYIEDREETNGLSN